MCTFYINIMLNSHFVPCRSVPCRLTCLQLVKSTISWHLIKSSHYCVCSQMPTLWAHSMRRDDVDLSKCIYRLRFPNLCRHRRCRPHRTRWKLHKIAIAIGIGIDLTKLHSIEEICKSHMRCDERILRRQFSESNSIESYGTLVGNHWPYGAAIANAI